MQMTPLVAIHLSAALAATVIGPWAMWARLSGRQKPKLHRAFGYAWVTLMIATATSAIFIRDFKLTNWNGYTPIHLLIFVVFGFLIAAFWFLARGNVRGHKRTMLGLYVGACLITGGLTLLPQRYLGQLVWGQWLGWI